jgi:carbamate kinase
MEKIVIALGGNAINRKGEKGTIAEQFRNTRVALSGVVSLIKDGYMPVITHGNGPQVGNFLLRVEAGLKSDIPDRPLGVLVADTEGGMGYMIEQSLQNKLKEENIEFDVATILSQILVDKNDPQIVHPSKPVGKFYDENSAKILEKEHGWIMREDAGRGYRRVVPSPMPTEIIEKKIIKKLVDSDVIVITAGGGGIPVFYDENGMLEGLDSVVDKDFASAVLGNNIAARTLLIATGVEKVAINFGKENQENLSKMTLTDCQKYIDEGHFAAGSMLPKIKAAMHFLERGGEKVIITLPEKMAEAMNGNTGTLIVKN